MYNEYLNEEENDFDELDEVECVMIANSESALPPVDKDVKDIEDDEDEEDMFDSIFNLDTDNEESKSVSEILASNSTRFNFNESMYESGIDSDVEEVEDDDDDDELDSVAGDDIFDDDFDYIM